jgi:hypothetical protein
VVKGGLSLRSDEEEVAKQAVSAFPDVSGELPAD